MAKCNSCGADLRYDAKLKKLICDYCGSTFNAADYDYKKASSKEVNDSIEFRKYVCNQCGGTILTYDDTAVTFCSYCGSSVVIDRKLTKETAPDYVIPFAITKEEAIEAYKKKINASLFVPKRLKDETVIAKFRGIYMPYGIINLSHDGACINKGSKYSHRSGNYDVYNDYNLIFNVKASYDGINYDLSSNFADRISHSIPFDYNKAVPFKKEYLSGFYADSKDIDIDIYHNDAINLVRDDAKNRLIKSGKYLRYGCNNPSLDLLPQERKVGMFPVYFLAIRDKKNEKINYAVINGDDGKVSADIPIDFTKYIIFSLILAVIIFGVINSMFVPTPTRVCFIGIIFSLICLIITRRQAKKIYQRQNYYDDKGYLVANKISEIPKMKFKDRIKYTYKSIIAFCFSLLVLIINPVDDMYFYIATFISLILTIWGFMELAKMHNELVSRKIPQMNKRGGDEHEI